MTVGIPHQMDGQEFGERRSYLKLLSDRVPARYVLTLLSFFGFFNVYALRVNLSIAITAMVNASAIAEEKNVSKECGTPHNVTTETQKDGEFIWDSNMQSIILGSFFYGYVITQVPGGRLAEMMGAKWLYGLGVLSTSLLTLVTPYAARLHVAALIVVRILEGLGEGVTFPAMHAMLGKWLPKYERSLLSTIVYSGGQLGTVASLPISGVLADSQFLGGWPSVFYVFGLVGCLWFVFWSALVHSEPEQHPRISLEEQHYIQKSLETGACKKKRPIPWLSILKSPPVWALIFTHFCQNWGFYTLLTELPTYLNSILHYNVKENGFLSALPYLLQALTSCLASMLADFIRRRGFMRISTIRKLFNSIGFIGPAVCLIGVTIARCNHEWSVTFFTLALGFNGLIYAGFLVTHMDMAPDFAGTLMGMTNGFGNLPGILAPLVVGQLTSEVGMLRQWNVVFYIASSTYLVGALVFILFGSAEIQPWAVPETDEETPDKPSGDEHSRTSSAIVPVLDEAF